MGTALLEAVGFEVGDVERGADLRVDGGRDGAVIADPGGAAENDARVAVGKGGRRRAVCHLRRWDGDFAADVDDGFLPRERRDVRAGEEFCLAVRDEGVDFRLVVEFKGNAGRAAPEAQDAGDARAVLPGAVDLCARHVFVLRRALAALRRDGVAACLPGLVDLGRLRQCRPVPLDAELFRGGAREGDDLRLEGDLRRGDVERLEERAHGLRLRCGAVEDEGLAVGDAGDARGARGQAFARLCSCFMRNG